MNRLLARISGPPLTSINDSLQRHVCRSPRKVSYPPAAHILAQVLRWQGGDVYAFTRSGDRAAQDLAISLGARWAGSSDEMTSEALDAAIIFAPVGPLVRQALRAVAKGGRVVCGGIHMSDIPQFPYSILWEERQILSVANLTRQDATEFLSIALKVGVKTTTSIYPLARANDALADLRGRPVSRRRRPGAVIVERL